MKYVRDALLVFGVLTPLVLILSFSRLPSVQLVERSKWPRELEELAASAELSSAEVEGMEVASAGWGGWFVRMPKSDRGMALVKDRWIPIAESSAGEAGRAMFFNQMPRRWKRERGSGPPGELYIHPHYNMDEDGNGTAYVGMIDDDYVYVAFYFNF